jgi:hypothetical protein
VPYAYHYHYHYYHCFYHFIIIIIIIIIIVIICTHRDYTRPVKDTVLYGLPSPPQHMADAVKVLIALQVRNRVLSDYFTKTD